MGIDHLNWTIGSIIGWLITLLGSGFYIMVLKRKVKGSELLLKNCKDIVYRLEIHPNRKFEFINSAVTAIMGYSPEDHQQDPMIMFRQIHPEDAGKLENLINDQADYSKPQVMRWIRKDGQIVWIEQNVTPFYNEKNQLVAIEAIARNVTDQKKMEQALINLSHFDSLTGLNNRFFFEELSKQLQENMNQMGMIVCDVDNLKLVNDELGHPVGDQLIKSAADVIRRSCRKDEAIARIGGDEFAVIIPGATEKILKQICKRISNEVIKYNKANLELPLSLSIGFAVGHSMFDELYKQADKRMYEEKSKKKQLELKASLV